MNADPGLLREIRELRGRSVEQVAKDCGVDRSTVERWESGDVKPYPRNREALALALNVPSGLLLRAVWGPTQEERRMYRRHLLQMVMGLPVFALPDLPGFDLHETTVRLVQRYATTAPAQLLADARIHLDLLTAALEGRLGRGQHRQLLVDAVNTASLAACAAKADGHPGEAGAYRVLARKLADESGIDRLRGCVLLHSAFAHRPVWGDGDPLAALQLLGAAAPLVGSRGLVAMEVAMGQAENYAALLDRKRDARAAIERAEAAGVGDDGEGFFSASGWFAGDDDPHLLAGWEGFCHLLLKRTDEGLQLLGHAVAVPHANARATAKFHYTVALGHTIAGSDPEPACEAAHRSLDVSEATGYRLGVPRIWIVRGRMLPEWADTQCVRALDERLNARGSSPVPPGPPGPPGLAI
ncbi:MAG: helix-turn-helix domain-containing protein [Egibacteraceae bacterium]